MHDLAPVAAGIAALMFYISVSHQRLALRLRERANLLRAAAWLLCVIAIACAMISGGFWKAFFISLVVFMLVAVALPYIDAWRALRSHADAA